MSSDNAALLSDHTTLEALRALYLSLETSSIRTDVFSARLGALGFTQTLESARFDEGVKRIFPRMKEFEKVCDAAKIKFPGTRTEG